jgi:hypothetical protein
MLTVVREDNRVFRCNPAADGPVLHTGLWIERAIRAPLRENRQPDGRIRRWVCVPEMESRYLRVILLADGQIVHNAFFDRRFVP